MSDQPFSLQFVAGVISDILAAAEWSEQHSADQGPWLPLTLSDDPGQSAGYVRVWQAGNASPLDRMVHMRLIAGPVETQLLFVFGRSDTCMPHLHLQVVQFPPDGCVYNVDLMPRLDAVEYPEWFTRVYGGLRRPYGQAISDPANSCSRAPANPALAVYMSPWGIASGRSDRAELERLEPQLRAYVSHYLTLATADDWAAPPGVDCAGRDERYLQLFFADELDPRAWHGVYKVVGEARGRMIKNLLRTPLRTTSQNNS